MTNTRMTDIGSSQPPTYGLDQEAAAESLRQLLQLGTSSYPDPDPDSGDVDATMQLLRCREAAWDALGDRLAVMELGLDRVRADVTRSGVFATVQPAGPQGGLAWVASVSLCAPRLPEELRGSPADALTTPSGYPAVEALRVAAGRLTAATHWLQGGSADWKNDDGARWAVTEDMAVTLEALTALDDRLTATLEAHCAPPLQVLRSRDTRLGCAMIERFASWHGSHHSSVDNAVNQAWLRPVSQSGPPAPIHGPGDLEIAHQRLNAMLDAPGTSYLERRVAAAILRVQGMVTTTLAEVLAEAATRDDDWAPHAREAAAQAERVTTMTTAYRGARLGQTDPGGPIDARFAAVMGQGHLLHAGATHLHSVTTGLAGEDVYRLLRTTHRTQQLLALHLKRDILDDGVSTGRLITTRPGQRKPFVATRRLLNAVNDIGAAQPAPRPPTAHSRARRQALSDHLAASPPPSITDAPFGPVL